ncbi:MAG: FkbM family methyltransferase [Verrucomicrobiota bacterium]
MGFNSIVRSLVPFGLVETRRRRLKLQRLGLRDVPGTEEAMEACRYELWPDSLRKAAKPWTLVDVGANTGEFTRAVASLVPLAGVHAFEPQPSCLGELKQVLETVARSHLHAAAVGSEAGEIELLCTANSRLASVLKPDANVADGYGGGDFKVQQHLKVPLVRLDDVIPAGTPVGLLKIDVQGYELPVLEGARQTLCSTTALLMEVNYVPHYEGGATFDDLCEAVRAHGFRTFGISSPYTGPKGPLWADALFVRGD